MLVVDASAAVKWFLNEERSDEAAALLTEGSDLSAPALILFEVVNALWVAVRQQRASVALIEIAAARLPALFQDLAEDGPLFTRATALMQQVGHPVYDCLYLALAERENLPLITADDGQFAAARKARIPVRLL